MVIRQELLEELLKDYKSPEDLLGQDGLLKELTKALVEKALDGELTHHLGYPKHSPSKSGNARNGKSKKGLLTDHGKMEIDSPRDRNASFEPMLVKKHQTRFDGFDDKILSMYARGMTVREIQGHPLASGLHVHPATDGAPRFPAAPLAPSDHPLARELPLVPIRRSLAAGLR